MLYKIKIVSIVAIGAICYLEHMALSTGHNGTVLKIAIAAIAALGGYNFKLGGRRRDDQ